jgi:HK97 family phage major capsid protein
MLKNLIEQRARLVEEMRSLVDGAADGAMTAEDENKFDALAAEVEALKARIEKLEKLEGVEEEVAEEEERARRSQGRRVPFTRGTSGDANAELRSFLLGQKGRDFLFQMGTKPMRAGEDARAWQARSLTTGTGAAGGFTVAPEFQSELERALLSSGGAREASRVIRTTTGAELPWPTLNDTTKEGRILGEMAEAAQEDMTFASVKFGAFKYTSDIVLISEELLQDSAFDLSGEIGTALGERIGRIANRHFTVGTGVAQPQGIVTGATLGVTGSLAAGVSFDDLVDLEHSVNSSYRKNAKFIFNDATLREIKKLKDGEGRPLWVPGLTANAPDTILGYQYVINDDVAPMAAEAKSILFGDVTKFIIRDVRDVTLRRLDERYAELGAVAFLAFSRHDSRVVDAGTNPIRFLQNAA